MREFSTGWFSTLNSKIEAKCNARVTRNYQEIRIDWAVYMRLKNASDSIRASEEKYIDVMVSGNPTKYGEDNIRIKAADETWSGTTEHATGGILTFEDTAAGSGKLLFSSTSNFASPNIFVNVELPIEYDEYDASQASETLMPFASVFTTEEYLEAHKNLKPRNNLCNN